MEIADESGGFANDAWRDIAEKTTQHQQKKDIYQHQRCPMGQFQFVSAEMDQWGGDERKYEGDEDQSEKVAQLP